VLPDQHLVDMGYIDADVLAQSRSRYQVAVVGPVPPDVSWQAKEALGFDHSQFSIDWQARWVTCPTSQTRKTRGIIPDRHGKPVIRVRFPASRSVRRVPSMLNVPTVGARVLIFQPNEQA